MPKNGFIYIGVLVIAASALLWASKWILDRVEYALPYTAIAGAVMIVIGIFLEIRKGKQALKPGDESAESITETAL